jgi:hypothetical protein
MYTVFSIILSRVGVNMEGVSEWVIGFIGHLIRTTRNYRQLQRYR